MTLPELLDSAAQITACFALIAICSDPDRTLCVLLPLILAALALIIRSDQKPHWRR